MPQSSLRPPLPLPRVTPSHTLWCHPCPPMSSCEPMSQLDSHFHGSSWALQGPPPTCSSHPLLRVNLEKSNLMTGLLTQNPSLAELRTHQIPYHCVSCGHVSLSHVLPALSPETLVFFPFHTHAELNPHSGPSPPPTPLPPLTAQLSCFLRVPHISAQRGQDLLSMLSPHTCGRASQVCLGSSPFSSPHVTRPPNIAAQDRQHLSRYSVSLAERPALWGFARHGMAPTLTQRDLREAAPSFCSTARVLGHQL